MRWPPAITAALLLLPPLAGCRGNGELVESELRAREEDVRVLREELERSAIYNKALQHELAARRGDPGCPTPTNGLIVRELVLGRGTGGHQSDHLGGDNALVIHLEPRDPEGQAVKVPAAVSILVQEVDEQGLKRPLSSWEVPPEGVRQAWRTGLFTTGYRFTFPWKVWPSTEKLRVVAHLRLTDGRVFEADKDITVRLLPEVERGRLFQDKGVSPPFGHEPLPPPRPLAPDPGSPAPPPGTEIPGPSLGPPLTPSLDLPR